MKIGFATFGMPPEYNRKVTGTISETDIEGKIEDSRHGLIRVHIHTAGELHEGAARLRAEGAECLIVVLSHWTRIALVVNLVRQMALPTALYARMTGGYNGITALTAASAGLREMPGSRMSDLHARFREGMEDELLKWLGGASAFGEMKRSRLMCWGGAYGANMPYTRSDPDWLESNLVAEVMTEQEVVLTDKAERILSDEPHTAQAFLDWVHGHGTKVSHEDPMCAPGSLRRQAALYLAARERLAELESENIRGVSLKCHFELSTTHWGCTGCMLPAFLPFPEGPEGPQTVVPVACEGDLNGLVSLLMLHSVNPDIPPLFGDFVEYRDDYVLLRNCGSASAYWAGASSDPSVSLGRTELLPNMHGKTGAAVHFETPAIDSITACRLFRLNNEFHAFVATGSVIEESESSRYTDPWPHTRIDFGLNSDLLFQAYPCNHASITRGNFASELEWICRFAGVTCHVMRSDQDVAAFLRDLYRT